MFGLAQIVDMFKRDIFLHFIQRGVNSSLRTSQVHSANKCIDQGICFRPLYNLYHKFVKSDPRKAAALVAWVTDVFVYQV